MEFKAFRLSPLWTRVEGPAGASAYVCAGTEVMFLRCPVDGMRDAADFFDKQGVNLRIDLRDPANDVDTAEDEKIDLPYETLRLPLFAMDKEGDETSRMRAYLRRRYDIQRVAEKAKEQIYRGRVPLIHCRASADRTGTVVATILLPSLGVDVVAQDFEDASVHAGHPRAKEEILPLLTF